MAQAFTFDKSVKWGSVHTGLKSSIPICLMSICAISGVERIEVGIDHFTRGPKSYVLSVTWMPARHHFVKVGHGICVESWVEQKARSNSQHKS